MDGKNYNIGIVLFQSNFLDIECDTDEAEANLKILFGGKIPKTPTWQSKRGKHRLFRRPSGLPEKAVLKIEDVEFRIGNDKGTMSVVPPSVHPTGLRYEWLQGLSIHENDTTELPSEVVKRLEKGERKAKSSQRSISGQISEGERNDFILRIACKLRDCDLSVETIENAVQIKIDICYNPLLPEFEIIGIVRSALQYEGCNPSSCCMCCSLSNIFRWRCFQRSCERSSLQPQRLYLALQIIWAR